MLRWSFCRIKNNFVRVRKRSPRRRQTATNVLIVENSMLFHLVEECPLLCVCVCVRVLSHYHLELWVFIVRTDETNRVRGCEVVVIGGAVVVSTYENLGTPASQVRTSGGHHTHTQNTQRTDQLRYDTYLPR